MADEDKPHIRWDEPNLKSNEEYAAANPKMKIDEAKTPYHRGKGPESLASPVMHPLPGAAPVEATTTADGEYHEFHLEAGMHDLAALSASALERRNRDSDEEEEGKGAPHQSRGLPSHELTLAVGPTGKHQKFDEARRAHYHTGGLAALRAKAASEGNTEEEEEEEAAPAAAVVAQV